VRSYGQYCSVAKALDVVGDRWTLLIIRELLLQGGCRYTDLLNGLPGIATNLLAVRLRELEDAGVVRRQAAPPPVATTLFHLTDAGLDLKPVLLELGRWGTRFMPFPSGDESFRSHWLEFPVSHLLFDGEPTGPATEIEVRTGHGVGPPDVIPDGATPDDATPDHGDADDDDQVAVIEMGGGEVRSRVGPATLPDLVITGSPPVVLGVLMRMLTLPEARRRGLRTKGNLGALHRLQPRPRVEAGSGGSSS
jgi:DNA-binding HxlR family transcriptional regulator